MDLSLERWECVSEAEREAIAKRLANELPTGFMFHGIELFQLGERKNHVALFRQHDVTYALIPGTTASLGFDPDRPWEPNQDELESWASTAEEYGIDDTIHEYIARVTLRIRQVTLSPLLVETVPREVGWTPIGHDDPQVRETLREHQGNCDVTFCIGDAETRVRRGPDRQISAERSVLCTHTDLAAGLAAAAFRFPTSDEWEYACGAGAATLFRWGDHVPCDRYPTDISREESDWRRRWVMSGGKLDRPAQEFSSDWDFHRQPNALGLRIASDPYKCELVAEIGVTRGGDGGSNICGGAGFFVGWLTLATAYFEEHACKHDPSESISHGYTIGRRVLQLQ